MAKNLSQLREQTRQKSDIENDGKHTSDTEVDSYINDSIKLLWSLLVDGTDGQLFAKNAGVLQKLGTYSYQLPGDFSQLVSVDINVNSRYVRSAQADPQDYAQLTDRAVDNFYTERSHFLRWSIEQNRAELFIFPEPNATSDVAVQYIPAAPVLSLDTDTLNWPDFWYQWVVLDAAIQCSNKEESIVQALVVEREKVERRIRDHIRSMTITEIKTIRKNTRGRQSRYNWGRGY
jgi:hypothetical protein